MGQPKLYPVMMAARLGFHRVPKQGRAGLTRHQSIACICCALPCRWEGPLPSNIVLAKSAQHLKELVKQANGELRTGAGA